MPATQRLPAVAIALLPAALVAWFAFHDGGFSPGAPALGAIVLAQVLVLRTTLAEHPYAGLGRGAAIAVGALGLLAIWTVASAAWSDAPARALIEFDRVLLYGILVVTVASLPREREVLVWIAYGLLVAILGVCVVGLATRLLPQTFPIAPGIANHRLSYPVGYWNALGLLATFGVVLAAHLTSSLETSPRVRVAAAAAVPALGATLLFTFSRGAIAAGIVGLLAYFVIARPRGLPAAALAVVPPTVGVLVFAYGAGALASRTPTTPQAVSQGRDVLFALLAGTVVAAVLRAAGLALDARMARAELGPAGRRLIGRSAAVGGVAAVLIAWPVLDLPGAVGDQYERFVQGGGAAERRGPDLRSRLLDPSNNGRIEEWRVALDAFGAAPLTGQGAGNYRVEWQRRRPYYVQVVDAHSLYLDMAADLGLVGALLVAGAVLALLAGSAHRARGPDRALYGAAFAVVLVWAIHAGIDWDWEMPVVTVVPLALGAAALAARARPADPARAPGRDRRVLLAVGWLVLAVAPVFVFVSEGRTNAAVAAYERGDCRTARERALSAVEALAARPDPYEILGYCDLEQGSPTGAVQAMSRGLARDPDNWGLRYGLALARARAGLDPRPAIRAAARGNPREPIVQYAVRAFATSDPVRWARAAGLLLQVRLQGRDLFAGR